MTYNISCKGPGGSRVQDGSGLLSILIAALIIGIIAYMYLGPTDENKTTGKTATLNSLSKIDRTLDKAQEAQDLLNKNADKFNNQMDELDKKD